MQTATILLALGGNQGNTVPKYDVTPSEVAVLQGIHGAEAVTDIHPNADEIDISDRAERSRLLERYGKFQNVDGTMKDTSPVSVLFPGVASRMFQSFDELDIDESYYKAETRVKATPAAKRRGKKDDAADDGIKDMEPGKGASVLD